MTDPDEAVAGARALYTDTWVSMGDEGDEGDRLGAFEPYRIDDAAMDRAAPDAVAMHPLPAHHGHEINTRSSTGRGRPPGTRPRTTCTPRPRCWRTSWADPGAPGCRDPHRDVNPTRRAPVLTIGLMALCTSSSSSRSKPSDGTIESEQAFVCEYGLVADNLFADGDPPIDACQELNAERSSYLTLFSSQFLHGGWLT